MDEHFRPNWPISNYIPNWSASSLFPIYLAAATANIGLAVSSAATAANGSGVSRPRVHSQGKCKFKKTLTNDLQTIN
eukprot:6299387-Amphidinium_carterae.1